MAIFWNYIKGINIDEDTITKIYFPPANDSTEFPTIKLFDKTDGSLKQDLGEIVTTSGSKQTIKNLVVNDLTIKNLTGVTIEGETKGPNVTTTGNLETNDLTVTTKITATTVEANDVNINTGTITNQLTLGKAIIDKNGKLTVNSITFI